MSITITPEIQATREAVLASLQHEDLHDQSVWAREAVYVYEDAGLVDAEKINRARSGERVEICGTVGCVAGHALLDRADAVLLIKDSDYEGHVRLQWVVGDQTFGTSQDAAKALAHQVIEQAGGADNITWLNEEDHFDPYSDPEDIPAPYQTVGALLLGLTAVEADLLFHGMVRRDHVLASLELLVAGEPIVTTLTPREFRLLERSGNYAATRVARATWNDNGDATAYNVLTASLGTEEVQ